MILSSFNYKFYIPKCANKATRLTCTKRNKIRAMIGDRLKPLGSVVNLLKISKYGSTSRARIFAGCLSQFNFDIILFILLFFYNLEFAKVFLQSHSGSSGSDSIKLNKTFLRFSIFELNTFITSWGETGGTSPARPQS